MKTTLKQLRAAGACIGGYNKLVRSLQGQPFTADEKRATYIRWAHSEEIPLLNILDSNGLDDALWALRASDCTTRDARLFSVACARQVQNLMAAPASINTLYVAERHANGLATNEELAAAWAAADAAAAQAAAAWAADWEARLHAARAARAAAWPVVWEAAWAAVDAAWAAKASWAATMDAASAQQEQLFRDMCSGCAPWQVA